MTAEELTIYDRWDQFMKLLSAQPRRQVIASLMDEPDHRRLQLPEAAITPEISINRDQFGIRLRQIHLPLLANASYIRWTESPFRVQQGDRFDEPASVMQVLLSSEDQLSPRLASSCATEPSG